MSSLALLVFNRSPEDESRYKAVTSSSSKGLNYRALKALSNHALRVADQSGIPVHHINEDHQVGQTFGERFTNAFKQLFNAGYDQVIAIGNDHPGLSKQHIQKAMAALNFHQHVLGPATDGGFYLMGLHYEAFKSLDFQQFPWQTSHLQKFYSEECAAQGHSTFKLEPLQDIDSPTDLRNLRVPYHYSWFKGAFVHWLKSINPNPFAGKVLLILSNPFPSYPRIFDSRGPPFPFLLHTAY